MDYGSKKLGIHSNTQLYCVAITHSQSVPTSIGLRLPANINTITCTADVKYSEFIDSGAV